MLAPLDDSLAAALDYSTVYLSSRFAVVDTGQHSQPSLCFQQVRMSGLPFCDACCDGQRLVLCSMEREEGRLQTDAAAR